MSFSSIAETNGSGRMKRRTDQGGTMKDESDEAAVGVGAIFRAIAAL
jgi:hypothetical protein